MLIVIGTCDNAKHGYETIQSNKNKLLIRTNVGCCNWQQSLPTSVFYPAKKKIYILIKLHIYLLVSVQIDIMAVK